MSFNLIFLTFIIFFAVLVSHIILLRILGHKKQISLLLVVTLVIPLLFFCIACILNSYFKFINWLELLTLGLLFFSLAAAYIQTYPPIQAFAPSLRILYLIGKTKGGLTEEEIRDNFSIGDLMTDRLDDLFTEDYIYENQSRLYLRPKGKFLAVVLGSYRNILGLETGEG